MPTGGSPFTSHNALRSPSVNGPIFINQGLVVGGPIIGGGAGFGVPISSDMRVLVVDPDGTTGLSNYTTIQSAINAAQPGDTILVQPGTYTEALTVTTDYLTILGAQLGGYGRPDVTRTTGIVLTVSAQGFVCARMRFFSTDGSDAVWQKGNGFRYADCVFDDASDAGKAGLLLKGDADDDAFTASEGVISGCLFRGSAIALAFDTGDAPGNGVGCTHDVIDGCRFIDNTQDIVTLDSGGGLYSVQDTLIDSCYFIDKGKANYIDFTTTNGGAASDQTGMVTNCYFATDDLTGANVAYVGTGFAVVGCYDAVGIEDSSTLD